MIHERPGTATALTTINAVHFFRGLRLVSETRYIKALLSCLVASRFSPSACHANDAITILSLSILCTPRFVPAAEEIVQAIQTEPNRKLSFIKSVGDLA